MNTVIITRKYGQNETFGDLVAYRNGQIFNCKTLELRWDQNKKDLSCIPKGIYNAKYSFFASKLRYNYLLDKVPNRAGIYIHSGNYAFKKSGKPDTQGCIILGISYADVNSDGTLDIGTSKVTVEAFQKFMNKEPFELLIR